MQILSFFQSGGTLCPHSMKYNEQRSETIFLNLSKWRLSLRYTQQRRAHDELLAEFERDLKTLAAIELHPAAQTPEFRRLSDLVPVQVPVE